MNFDDFMSGPSCWPVNVRRAFLLTLPASAPLYFVAIAVTMVSLIAFGLVFMLPYYAAKACWQWFRDMWRRP